MYRITSNKLSTSRVIETLEQAKEVAFSLAYTYALNIGAIVMQIWDIDSNTPIIGLTFEYPCQRGLTYCNEIFETVPEGRIKYPI